MSTIGFAPAADEWLRTSDAIAMPPSGCLRCEGAADRSDRYPIYVTSSLGETAERLAELIGERRVAVVTDATVHEVHGQALLGALDNAELDVSVAVVKAGEINKSLDQLVELWNWLAAEKVGSDDCIVAFGGGVINDLGGFAALGYTRGIRYINVPTTLVGHVDAAIGGKVAVNHTAAKNLIGGFHQPAGVVSGVDFLDTLDTRQIRAGLAETIKKALIASPDYLMFIDEHLEQLLDGDHDALRRLVVGASHIKAELIARDPYENDPRRTLGFGHALAHPIETVTGYGPILHGEAVSMGMAVELRMASALGLLDEATRDRALELLRRAGLPIMAGDLAAVVPGRRLLASTERYALSRGGAMRWVMLRGVGYTAIADHLPNEVLHGSLEDSGFDLQAA